MNAFHLVQNLAAAYTRGDIELLCGKCFVES